MMTRQGLDLARQGLDLVVVVAGVDPFRPNAQVLRRCPVTVDNVASESFCKATAGLSKLRGAYQMRDSRIKDLRDAMVVTAADVDTKANIADKLTKGLSHDIVASRESGTLDREMDEGEFNRQDRRY